VTEGNARGVKQERLPWGMVRINEKTVSREGAEERKKRDEDCVGANQTIPRCKKQEEIT
jgi:hypothetical protein